MLTACTYNGLRSLSLSELLDRFRWIFCLLEVLRDCLPSSVRRTLSELPESLDATYERILKEIKKPNRDIARRVLQCLVVATRPLRVAELAEVLAVDFDDAEGIPRLNPDWRWEDQEHALLIACSSLIAIVQAGDNIEASDSDTGAEANESASEVEAGHSLLEAETNDDYSHFKDSNSESRVDASDNDLNFEGGHVDSEAESDNSDLRVKASDSRIVQFSHFSVKEFLTSSRLATAGGEVSNYHIDLKSAHTNLAQACLGVLLQIQVDTDGHTPVNHSLAQYAAENWTTHAQLGEVSSHLQNGMAYLFDPDKPHFKGWLTMYDIDTDPSDHPTFYLFTPDHKSPATPLYYAALCGFRDLVEHLITKYPQYVNADGGWYMRPLVAALAGEHFQTANLLRQNRADPGVQGRFGRNPLHVAAGSGNFEVVRILIGCDSANIDARDGSGSTPLHRVSGGRYLKDGFVPRVPLERGADINVQNQIGRPLHRASIYGALEVVRLLLEHGANVDAKDNDRETALQVAARHGHDEVVELLRKHGAK